LLGACSKGGSAARARVVLVVEGRNDYELVRGLLGDHYASIEFAEGFAELFEKARRCHPPCIIAQQLRGIGNLNAKTLRPILYGVRALTRLDCVAVVIDSDDYPPAARLQRILEKHRDIGDALRRLYTAKPFVKDGEPLAYMCFTHQKLPSLCIASWRCSAECWIALALETCSVTSLEHCDEPFRRRCRQCLRDAEKRPHEAVAEAIHRRKPGPWVQGLVSLRDSLLDP